MRSMLSIVLGAVVLLGAFGLATATGGQEKLAQPPTVLPVSTVALEQQAQYQRRRIYVGRVEAAQSSRIGFELAGRVASIWVDEGDEVTAGSVLAELDTDRLRAQRAELGEALRQTKAELALARSTLRRFDELTRRGHASKQELDEADESARALSAAVRLAEARIASVDVDLSKAILRAPFNGVVVKRFVDEGRVGASGEPIIELQTSDKREVRIGVSRAAARLLRVDEAHAVYLDGARASAIVKAILPLRTANTRTIDVLLTLDERADAHPGDLVELRLADEVSADGFWVEIRSMTDGPRGLWSVFVAEPIDEEGSSEGAPRRQISRRLVDVLFHDGERAYVRGSLRDGERLVEDGLHRVVPGQLVMEREAAVRERVVQR